LTVWLFDLHILLHSHAEGYLYVAAVVPITRDPSGSYFLWKASAIGKNVSSMWIRLEGQISGKNIEIGIVGADRVFRVLTPAEVDDYLAEVE
jgi:20S proteasome alpha/beta subunit